MEGNGVNAVGDNQVKTWDNKTTARAVPETDARDDSRVEASNEEAEVTIDKVRSTR